MTGAKYSDLDPATLRELFVAYEVWHMELFDVFGEDPLNDLMAEDALRLFARALREGKVNRGNLGSVLSASFDEARAWVGSLVRLRRAELEQQILRAGPAPTQVYEDPDGVHRYPYGRTWIREQLEAGWSVDAVSQWSVAQTYAGVWGLIESADQWERAHGEIEHTTLVRNLARGKLDAVCDKVRHGDPAHALGAGDIATAVLAKLVDL
jgi:hypothetical protein